MNELFLNTVNRSIAAGWIVLAVLVLRFVLKKAPRWTHVLLWGIVALRLVQPFSVESSFSLIPSVETFSPDIEMAAEPSVDSGIREVNEALNPVMAGSFTPNPLASANPLQIWIALASLIWMAGMAGMLFYAAFRLWRLRRRLDTAVLLKNGLYQSENAVSPFVLGLFRPKIYLPFGLSGEELEYVTAHEQAHIRRGDHWWKLLGFLLLAVYWFHPLLWLAYGLLCRDLELACDEKVIQGLDGGQRAGYTQTLVSLSVSRRGFAACPLAFGEVGVKDRVKSIMNYRKPGFWLVLVSVVICALAAACFLTSPRQDSVRLGIVVPAGSQESIVYAEEEIVSLGNEMIIISGEGLGDTEVSLKVMQAGEETAYGEPAYLTPGMPVKIRTEKGMCFKIGVNMQNDTDEDKIVYLNVEHAEAVIEETAETNLEKYRTDYIGDAPAVSQIARQLPYPEDYAYSSIELQTAEEPYELTVYLSGETEAQQGAFEECAASAFDLIGNMGVITFCQADTGEILASFSRTD